MGGLQRKPGQGIDLRQFGLAEIKRASLVEWDETEQAWFIDVLQDAGKGVVTLNGWLSAIGATYGSSPPITLCDIAPSTITDARLDWDKPILFGEYDDAVKVEIAYLDALRLRGEF
jgi:hypothetical protein